MFIRHNFTNEAELKKNLDYIYSQSQKGKSFNGILEVAFNEVTITTAIHNIKSNKGANTAGIDGAKIDKYLQMEKDKLITLIRKEVQNYRPRPVRRHYIKKSNGKMRPLGIPTIMDRIIQECLRMVIEPIVEAKFYPNSYGFRPYRATKHAVRNIFQFINKPKVKAVHVIEGDIKGYFDNINHKILIKKLWKIGIHDKRVLAIIKAMLEAGYMEKNITYDTESGTVQGGIISPLLANVYLNDFDWTIGRMYHYPKERNCINIGGDRQRLCRNGIRRKYLIRYADDWLLLTTTYEEANRMLKYLKKYFRHRLKLELSDEKTIITDLTQTPAKFLGFMIKAELPRKTPKNPNPVNIVGKNYPDMEKVKAKVRQISKELKILRYTGNDTHRQAIIIETINSKIVGLAEYYKSSICSFAYKYMDRAINNAAFATFKRLFGKKDWQYQVPMNKLSNRPQRHRDYRGKTFATLHQGMYIGITKAFITHSNWEKYCFNQKITPYTEDGRRLYMQNSNRKKQLPKDRPPIYDMDMLNLSKDNRLSNFEYHMNREYAYNRDKGKCRICGRYLKPYERHCHRIDENLPIGKINKVVNLSWLCNECDTRVHSKEEPYGLSKKVIKKILVYQSKLK